MGVRENSRKSCGAPKGLFLEMHDNSSGKLEIVLVLAKKAGVDEVAFEAARKSVVKVVIGAATELESERVPASIPRRLRLLVSSAEDGMQPGIPPLVSVPGNLRPGSVDEQLHVFAAIYFWREGG
jgi:hypothetical protein